MPTPALHALKAYAKVGIETGIPEANPHRLVLMLFEGAILAVTDAKRHMLRGEIAAKGESVSKAIMIINDGLRVSLDIKAGGQLAQNLHALYEYMSSRLLFANARNEPAVLDEIKHLLAELKEAWEAIGKPQGLPAANEQRPATMAANRA